MWRYVRGLRTHYRTGDAAIEDEGLGFAMLEQGGLA